MLTYLTDAVAQFIEDRYAINKADLDEISYEYALHTLAEYIGRAKSTLAVNELSRLLKTDLDSLKKIINKNKILIGAYFKIVLRPQRDPSHNPKEEYVNNLTIKMRFEPLLYLAMLLGILRFTGELSEALVVKKSKKKYVLRKMHIPEKAPKKYRIIRKACPDVIDNYPDTVMFLTVNCLLTNLVPSKYSWRGMSALEIALYYLGRRVIVEKLKESSNEEIVPAGTEKIVLYPGENPQI